MNHRLNRLIAYELKTYAYRRPITDVLDLNGEESYPTWVYIAHTFRSFTYPCRVEVLLRCYGFNDLTLKRWFKPHSVLDFMVFNFYS